MKHFFCAVLVACAALCGQNATPAVPVFVTGQAARAVFGQATFTAQDDSSSINDLGGTSALAVAGGKLYVVDSNRVGALPDNNRVIIYSNLATALPSPTAELNTAFFGETPCPVCVNHRSLMTVLGQADLTTTVANLTQAGLREPTGVATDGHILVVADTDNNRVLIWHTLPTSNNALPDTVLGQPDFTHAVAAKGQKGLSGPGGVWIQGTRLFVADTVNGRVLVWNNIPSANNQPADYVLGEPDFNTTPPPDSSQSQLNTTASNMVSPVGVSSDGTHLFVSDLGQNRIMIWNSIPTQSNIAADIFVGQPNASGNLANNVSAICASEGNDSSGNPIYPPRCSATLSFPRFALSDGTRLFIADSGNDRVLIYNSIPKSSGAKADVILGQPNDTDDNVTDDDTDTETDAQLDRSGADQLRTPTGLAWDGTNLYVSDPYDLRVSVFSPGQNSINQNGVLNAASLEAFAIGTISFAGTVTTGNTITVTINSTNYTYTTVKNDTIAIIVAALVKSINTSNSGAGDPNVLSFNQAAFDSILLTARAGGQVGNNITYSATDTDTTDLTVTTLSSNLEGGTQSEIAPGALVTLMGSNFTDEPATSNTLIDGGYSHELAGVEVYFDGIRAPLLYVSPTQINAQIPFEVDTTSGVTTWVRSVRKDGTITNTVPQAAAITGGNPGIFAGPGKDPRPVIAYHYSSYAIGLIDMEGTTFPAGETVTATINSVAYTYTIQSTDTTLTDVQTGLINAINAGNGPVVASAAGEYNRIILTAKKAGSTGDGISIAVTTSNSSGVTMTALNTSTCCASKAGTLVTSSSPAVPGETIVIYATGLGTEATPTAAQTGQVTGKVYTGPVNSTLTNLVDDSEVGGSTANVLFASLVPGAVGLYEVVLQLDSSLTTNSAAAIYIAQEGFVSNIVTIPVTAP